MLDFFGLLPIQFESEPYEGEQSLITDPCIVLIIVVQIKVRAAQFRGRRASGISEILAAVAKGNIDCPTASVNPMPKGSSTPG